MKRPYKVVFLIDVMPHYRLAFFETLRQELQERNIDLEIICGVSTERHNIVGKLEWATTVPLKSFGSFTWLSALSQTRDADLLIVPQVLRHLHIYPILLRHQRRTQRIAMWGHGKLFSTQPQGKLHTALRYLVSRQVFWWFAYTEKSARAVLRDIGFDSRRITTVNNSVDTQLLSNGLKNLDPETLQAAREKLGIHTENVALFMGGMYKTKHHDKRLPFLVAACEEVRRQIPDFEMIFIGGGSEASVIKEAASRHPWIHYLGILKGLDAIPYWAMSKLLLVPGAVGLVILDSLATGTPMVTSNDPCHGPEISYFKDGENGVMVQDLESVPAYAGTVVRLLQNDEERNRLREGCFKDAGKYSTRKMVERFTEGIVSALSEKLVPEITTYDDVNKSLESEHFRAKVAMLMNDLPHYRKTFLNSLRARLAAENVGLLLIHGSYSTDHNIADDVPWAVKRKLWSFGSYKWLDCLDDTKDLDLVIVPQVMRQLHSIAHIVRGIRGKQKIALWGHGKVFSATPPSPIVTWFKNLLSRQCEWWFAYTAVTANVVKGEIQFPLQRITVVNNAVDTVALSEAKNQLRQSDLDQLREELGIRTRNVGIFVGGMYHNQHHSKRLPFLIECCKKIRLLVPDFEMIFVGGGPKQWVVEDAASACPWIHYVGVQKGVAAVPYWALSKICLNPGLVGLSILDGFALGVPLVTSDIPYHSPEIAYLSPGENGIMVDDHDDPEVFARTAVDLLLDEPRIEALAAAGRVTVSTITNEAMVDNFAKGILAALRLKPLQPSQVPPSQAVHP